MDVSETTIAEDTLKRGSSNVGDTYISKLEIRERSTPKKVVNDYKLLEVLEFIPGSRQQFMFKGPPVSDTEES